VLLVSFPVSEQRVHEGVEPLRVAGSELVAQRCWIEVHAEGVAAGKVARLLIAVIVIISHGVYRAAEERAPEPRQKWATEFISESLRGDALVLRRAIHRSINSFYNVG
jgi:hypothetical protein